MRLYYVCRGEVNAALKKINMLGKHALHLLPELQWELSGFVCGDRITRRLVRGCFMYASSGFVLFYLS